MQIKFILLFFIPFSLCLEYPSSWIHSSPVFTDIGFFQVVYGKEFFIVAQQQDGIGEVIIPSVPLFFTDDFQTFSSSAVTPFSQDGTPNAIAASDSLFMWAIYTSKDGKSWTRTFVEFQSEGALFANGLFLTWFPDSENSYQEGSSLIMFSEDGINWDNISTPLFPVANVWFIGDTYYIIGPYPENPVVTTTDLKNFQSDYSITSVVFIIGTNEGVVAFTRQSLEDSFQLYEKKEGETTWNYISSINNTYRNPIPYVAYGNGIAVMNLFIGQEPNLLTWFITSDNFKTFTSISVPEQLTYVSGIVYVSFLNGMFVAYGPVGTLATSTDGMTWNIIYEGLVYGLINVFTHDNNFIAPTTGFNNSGPIYISLDGFAWKQIESFVNLTSLSYSKELDQFILTTGQNLFISEQLGAPWKQIDVPSNFYFLAENAPVYGNGIWVYAYNYGLNEASWGDLYTSDSAPWDSWNITYSIYSGDSNAWISPPVFINSTFYTMDNFNQLLLNSTNGKTWDIMQVPYNCTPAEITKANHYLYLLCSFPLALGNFLYNPEDKENHWIETNVQDGMISYLDLGVYAATYPYSNEFSFSKDGINFVSGNEINSTLFLTDVTSVIGTNNIFMIIGGHQSENTGTTDLWIGKN